MANAYMPKISQCRKDRNFKASAETYPSIELPRGDDFRATFLLADEGGSTRRCVQFSSAEPPDPCPELYGTAPPSCLFSTCCAARASGRGQLHDPWVSYLGTRSVIYCRIKTTI
eukprot:scaffold544835_cov55-Prasinocladus_malaysianus.AAC.1